MSGDNDDDDEECQRRIDFHDGTVDLESELELDDQPTTKAPFGLDADDNVEERRRERRRIPTQRKLRAINREGLKNKRQHEKGSSGKESPNKLYDQYREAEKKKADGSLKQVGHIRQYQKDRTRLNVPNSMLFKSLIEDHLSHLEADIAGTHTNSPA